MTDIITYQASGTKREGWRIAIQGLTRFEKDAITAQLRTFNNIRKVFPKDAPM